MLRILAGDGCAVSMVTAQNLTNRNTQALAPVVAFGPTSYVTTAPSPGDVISVTVDGVDSAGAQCLVAFDSHADNVQIHRARLTQWGSTGALIGHVALAASFSPTLTRIKVSNIIGNSTAGDICALNTRCTVNGLKISDILVNQCKAVLNNACNVTGLDVADIHAQSLTENPFKSTGTETGTVRNVTWDATSGNFTTAFPVRANFRMSGQMPVLTSTDVTPKAALGSRIVCDYTKDPTGQGGVTGGEYIGNGEQWKRTVDLGGFQPGQLNYPLLFHVDASQMVGVSDGAALASLVDLTGLTLSQATSGKRPTYVASPANLNSKPAIRFDGVDDFLQSAAITSVAAPISLFVVGVWRAIPTTAFVFDGSVSATARLALYKIAGGIALFAGSNLTDGTPVVNTAYIYSGVNGVSGAGTLRVNAINATVSGSPGTGGFTGVTLGADKGGASPAQIDIAEAFAFSGALTQTEINTVQNYLAAKYAITVA
jgi:hypothetical protein